MLFCLLAGFWWWLLTAAEFEYSNIYGVVRSWRTRTKFRQLAALMPQEMQMKPSRDVVEVDGALHPIKMPHNPEELAFLAEIDRLRASAAAIRAEIDALDVE